MARTLAAANDDLTRPDDAEMAADAETLGMTPLFDGDTLERI
jgi:hypothetical protein